MKLTDEMHAALIEILTRYGVLSRHDPRPAGIDVDIYVAGYRMGQQAMRERAAKECEAADERAYPFACAAMIRALSTEE